MLSSFPVSFIVGTLLGFLSGLGIGGGSLLMLWLNFVIDMDADTARTVNLMFFIPSALSASVLRGFGREKLQWRTILPGALAGCSAAILLSFFRDSLDATVLRKGFGVLLIAAGLRELMYRDPKKKTGR